MLSLIAQLKIPRQTPISPGAPPYEIAYPTGFGTTKFGTGEECEFSDIGSIISCIYPYILVGAGLILFILLIAGGFEILTAAGNQEKVQQGAGRIKNAFLGFLVLFALFWLAQIFQILFKIPIL